jgi:amino acid transporter
MSTSTSTRGTQEGTGARTKLRRDVGVIGLLFASVGSIIGSGWLFGALNAAQAAGPAAIISWALGGFMILLIALVYAELGTMFPLSGGVVRFPHLAFGSFASYTAGWITWVAVATVAPIEVEGALQYATKYAPFTTAHTVGGEAVHTLTGLGYAVAVVAMAVFVVINYIGVRWFAKVNNVLVWWKLAIILLVIVAFLVTTFHTSNFSSHGFRPEGWHGVFSAIATSGIVFSYLGFRQGVELAGETSNPRRNVPIAVIGSVLLTAIIYVGLQVAFIGAVTPAELAKSHGWANLSFANDFGPLAATATIIGLGWLAVLLYIDAVVSPADTGLIYTTVTARVSYAAAKNGNAAPSLGTTNRQGVPWISLLLAFVVGLIIFLPFPSWQQLVGFITSATVLSFGSGPLVLSAMRRQLPDHERTFRLPIGDVLAFLAFYSSNLIVYWAGWTTDWKLFVAVLLGFIVLGLFHVTGKVTARMDLRAGATWMIPWLGGLAIISWLGAYGGGRGLITFGIAFPIIGVFSLAIFLFAVRMRLHPDRVAELVEESREEAEVEARELGASAH